MVYSRAVGEELVIGGTEDRSADLTADMQALVPADGHICVMSHIHGIDVVTHWL
jgi:hypothetical protein